MLKGRFVPHELRATIYNLFRVPLNAIVLSVLLTDTQRHVAFACCFLLLSTATAAQWALHSAALYDVAAKSEVTFDAEERFSFSPAFGARANSSDGQDVPFLDARLDARR